MYTKKQLPYIYIYNKTLWLGNLKKEWEGKSIDSIKLPLDDLSQPQIENLRENVRNNLFIEDKPKKKKKDDTI